MPSPPPSTSSSQADLAAKPGAASPSQQSMEPKAGPARPNSQAIPVSSRQRSSSVSSQTNRAAGGLQLTPHRSSFIGSSRHPQTPLSRTHSNRRQSLSHQALQDLLSQPYTSQRYSNSRFAGRDWTHVTLAELVSPDDAKWVTLDTSVEEATMTLLKSSNSSGKVVLVRESPTSELPVASFDHGDLNAYLLVVVGLAQPSAENVAAYDAIAQKARSQVPIALREIQVVCHADPLVMLPSDSTLDKALEVLGSGLHRVIVTNSASSKVIGVLSPLQLIEFFWTEGFNFPTIERLHHTVLRDLQIGSQQIIAVHADAPLSDALTLMNNEGLSSVAVVDPSLHVVGNISTSDVRHLIHATSIPLLYDSCWHFISFILSERGVENGRDFFPVLYVTPCSTLAHTVAKLVATHSHRMWIVESPSSSPASTAPPTPTMPYSSPSLYQHSSSSTASLSATRPTPTVDPSVTTTKAGSTARPSSSSSSTGAGASGSGHPAATTPTIIIPPLGPMTPSSPAPPPPSALSPGHNSSSSDRLIGVVSLTDILNLFAKSIGLHPGDPGAARAQRRRSSSSSLRPSLDCARPSVDVRRG